jgi:predicted permease
MNDFRFALRTLAKSPGFTIVSVVTLALGIGANTAVFSVVDGVLLRRAPVEDIARLVMIWETDRTSGTTREPASVPDYLDFVTRQTRFSGLAAFQGQNLTVTPDGGEPARVAALAVTHQFLPLLGIRPTVGRNFDASEDRPGGPSVAIVSEGFWRDRLGADPDVLGRTLRLDEHPHTIIGVAGSAAAFGATQILSAAAYSRSFADRGEGADVEVWVPLQPNPETTPRSTHPIFVVGRLRADARVEAAQQEMAAITADLERAHPENRARGAFVEPMTAVVFGPVRPALLAMLGAVAFVLLVACANVANLLLIRGTARSREVVLRAALGASVRRLARQFVIEGLILSLVGAAAGILVAWLGLMVLLALAPAEIPRLDTVGLDLRVLGVTLTVSMVVGLIFGLLPMRQIRRKDFSAVLKSGGPTGSAEPGQGRLRAALVVAEVALAVVLVAGAGLLLRTFEALHQIDPGFRPDGVLKAEYQLPASRYPADFTRWPNWIEAHRLNAALAAGVQALPGVASVALAGNHPVDHGFTNSFVIVGREAEARDWPEISVRRVTPAYFATMEVALVRGRLLRDGDDSSAPPVALINRAAEQRFFGDREPIGPQIAFWGARRTIVGVVADEKFQGLTAATPPAVYLPLAQSPSANGAYALLVRTTGEPTALAGGVRSVMARLDPGVPLFGVEPMQDAVSRTVADRRFAMMLIGLSAALALVLAAIGAHGVLGYSVAQQTREIGIRMALGARPGEMLRSIVRQGLLLAAAGIVIGLVGAAALTRLLGTLLFGVSPRDPLTFVAVPVVIVAVALAACIVPARRAARVDPMKALRFE